MPMNGIALAGLGGGILLAYSAVKGKSILAVIPALIKGTNPGTLPNANPITTSVPLTGATYSGTPLQGSVAAGKLAALSGGGNAGSSAASYQAYAFSLFPQFGWGSDQQQPLILLWNQESGWNPTAQNASSAYGIAQFLDSTWAPYGPKTSDPALQIQYGLEYIRDRYGNPAGAWAFENSHSPAWY